MNNVSHFLNRWKNWNRQKNDEISIVILYQQIKHKTIEWNTADVHDVGFISLIWLNSFLVHHEERFLTSVWFDDALMKRTISSLWVNANGKSWCLWSEQFEKFNFHAPCVLQSKVHSDGVFNNWFLQTNWRNCVKMF